MRIASAARPSPGLAALAIAATALLAATRPTREVRVRPHRVLISKQVVQAARSSGGRARQLRYGGGVDGNRRHHSGS